MLEPLGTICKRLLSGPCRLTLSLSTTDASNICCASCAARCTQRSPRSSNPTSSSSPSRRSKAHSPMCWCRSSLTTFRCTANRRFLPAQESTCTARRWPTGLARRRSTSERWCVQCLAAELKTSQNLGVDETPVRVLDPGRGKTKTGYMWTMAHDERAWCGADPPGVVYRYAPSRGGAHGEKLLEGFSGTAQVDGYSGYNRLRRAERPGGALTLASCWTHARRGMKEVFDSDASPIAKASVERIAQLYAIEKTIRGEPPATRRAVRWRRSPAATRNRGSGNFYPGTSTPRQTEVKVGHSHRLRCGRIPVRINARGSSRRCVGSG